MCRVVRASARVCLSRRVAAGVLAALLVAVATGTLSAAEDASTSSSPSEHLVIEPGTSETFDVPLAPATASAKALRAAEDAAITEDQGLSEARNESGARGERLASEQKFADKSAEGALQVVLREAPEILDATAGPELRDGDRVVRFEDDQTALIEQADGDRALVTSATPLRTNDGEKVDLDFEAKDGGFAPRRGLSPVVVSTDPDHGVTLGSHGVRIGLTNSTTAPEPKLVEGKVFWANVAKDSDLAVAGTPTGVETFHVLRSSDSPEDIAYGLHLPDGSSATQIAGGGYEIRNGDTVLATIGRPTATDADGVPVAVTTQVSGSDLTMRVAHRSVPGGAHYPVVVDPPLANPDTFDWSTGGSYAEWTGATNAPTIFTFQQGNAGIFGNALFVSAKNGTAANYMSGSEYANYSLRAPGDAEITGATLGQVRHVTASGTCVGAGIYSTQNHAYEAGTADHNGTPTSFSGKAYVNDCFYGAMKPSGPYYTISGQTWNVNAGGYSVQGTPGNQLDFQDTASSTYGAGNRYFHLSSIQSAIVYLRDDIAPIVDASAPTNWTNDPSAAVSASAKDNGLGIKRIKLSSPTAASWSNNYDYSTACTGNRTSRCTTGGSGLTRTTTVGSLPEGQQTVKVEGWDAVGNTASKTIPVKVDQSAPTGTLSGVSDGQALRAGSYPLTVTIDDALSGTKRVALTLDGVEKAANAACSGATCTLSWTLDAADTALAEGPHTLAVTSTDQAGNTSSTRATTNVFVDRTAPTADAGGDLRPEAGGWVPAGIETASVDASDGGSGVDTAKLEVDGQVVDTANEPCPDRACDFSAPLEVDTSSWTGTSHNVAVTALDAAGNATRTTWTVRSEATKPDLSLSGTLPQVAGQTLDRALTYDLNAHAADPSSGVQKLSIGVDEETPQGIEQSCDAGACSGDFGVTIDPKTLKPGDHTVRVTATDAADNVSEQTLAFVTPAEPAKQCNPGPAPAVITGGTTNSPAQAVTTLEQSPAFPTTSTGESTSTAAAAPFALNDQNLQPALTDTARFEARDSLADSAISKTASQGPTIAVPTEDAPICMTQTTVGAAATAPPAPENGTAAVFANNQPAEDLIVRPTVTGVETFHQVRTDAAPDSISWRVDLAEGQKLENLSDGTVALVEDLGADASPPDGRDAPPPVPTQEAQAAALVDPDQQLSQAEGVLTRAQRLTGNQVLAVIPDPWARDDSNQPTPASVQASGSTVTIDMPHDTQTDYPVVVDPQVVSASAVARAAAQKSDAASASWDVTDAASFDDGADTGQASVLDVAGTGATLADGAFDAGERAPADPSAADLRSLTGDAGATIKQAQASAAVSKATLKTNLSKLEIGQTDYPDPAGLEDTSLLNLGPAPVRDATGKVTKKGAVLLRPVVPWNIMDILARARQNPRPAMCSRELWWSKVWPAWAARARKLATDLAVQGRQLKTLVTFVPVNAASRSCGQIARPEPNTYKPAIKAFLAPASQGGYGDLAKAISPWNEPNYSDGFFPATDSSIYPATFWKQANELCHPKPAAGKPAVAKCEAVAGEFAGGPNDITYAKKYASFIGTGKKPAVWGFHAYADAWNYELRASKGRLAAPIIKRFDELYKSKAFKTTSGRVPRIFLTAVGAGYSISCKEILKKTKTGQIISGTLKPWCPAAQLKDFGDGADAWNVRSDGSRRRVGAVLGQRRQAQAMAFLFEKLAKYPEIERMYLYGGHYQQGTPYSTTETGSDTPSRQSGWCSREAVGVLCPRSDWGLMASQGDVQTAGKAYMAGGGASVSTDGPGSLFPTLETVKGRDIENWSGGAGDQTSFSSGFRAVYCLVRDRTKTAGLAFVQNRGGKTPKC